MGREREWKFAGTEAAFAALQRRFGPLEQVRMQTTYYDTPDAALSRRKWTLRCRMEDEISVCTCKIPLADGSRGEWETQAPTIAEGLPALCRDGAPAALLGYGDIVPLCGARFTRLLTRIVLPEATVELALDRGVLLGGGRETPLLEVEVEYKGGSEEAAEAFARTLAAEMKLTEEPLSKFARAMRLTV